MRKEQQGHDKLYNMGFDGAAIATLRHLNEKQYIEFQKILKEEFHKENEQHTYQRNYLINSLAILMGGRCAEEICLGEMTTGAGNDIERATEMARKMVCEWGMSEKMGPLTYGTNDEQPFLGKGSSSQANFSDQTAKLIDQEVKTLVMGGYEKATELLKTNLDKLETMAQALLEHETLNAQEVKNIIDGKNIFDDEIFNLMDFDCDQSCLLYTSDAADE